MGLWKDFVSIMLGEATPQTTREQVERRIQTLASQKSEKLDWRNSVVDLMKVLDLDSSFDNRKKLANKLGYLGVLNGSALMNEWLHNAIMANMMKNNGVPKL